MLGNYVDWVKRCMMMETDRTGQRSPPKKTWLDCVKEGMKCLGLSREDAQSRNKWRRIIRRQLVDPGSPGKTADKRVCVSVYT